MSAFDVGPKQARELPGLANRLTALQARHRALEAEIHRLEAGPLPDQVEITPLKREKLGVKEEIERLQK